MKNGIRQVMAALSLVGNMGFALAVNALVGVFFGHMVDQRFNCSPWGVAVGAMFGLIAGMRSIYHKVSCIIDSKEDEENNRPDNNRKKS